MNAKVFFGTALVSVAILGGAVAASVAARTVEITADDTMKYSVTTINAKPGEMLTVKLTNKGTMPKAAAAHNFVLLKKGADITAFTTAAVMAGATDYVPQTAKAKADIITSTKLAGPGETVETTFAAPAAAGSYPFICSFPGHFATMKGTVVVGGAAAKADKK